MKQSHHTGPDPNSNVSETYVGLQLNGDVLLDERRSPPNPFIGLTRLLARPLNSPNDPQSELSLLNQP